MDAFKWVKIEEAREMLHDTQVAALDVLEDIIYDHRSDKFWCVDCKETTPHRKKLSAIMAGNQVCGKCSRMNPIPKI